MGSQLLLCQIGIVGLFHSFRSLNKALDAKLNFNIAFHPQTDGQLERTIQILEDMQKAYVIDMCGAWDCHLSLVEFAYNNSYQVSINRSF